MSKPLVRVEFVGADELIAAFSDLRESVKRRVIKKAVTKGARILVRPIRRATPKSPKGSKSINKNPSGTTRKSTGVVGRTYLSGNLVESYVGHLWPAGAAAHLSDQGTRKRRTKKGYNRGSVKAGRWFEPAYQSVIGQVESVIVHSMRVELEKARAKAARKALSGAVR